MRGLTSVYTHMHVDVIMPSGTDQAGTLGITWEGGRAQATQPGTERVEVF